MQHLFQLLEDKFVPLFLLHLKRLLQKIAFPQMIDHELEQVDMLQADVASSLGDVITEKADVLANIEFRFGRIVENEKSDLVTQALRFQEFGGGDSGQNLIESLPQRFIHDST